ncbi:hypothetical protein COCC4DRAFT_29843, partial [Bipolaris maydis ATCC 48331]
PILGLVWTCICFYSSIHPLSIVLPARAEYCTLTSSLHTNPARIHDRDEHQRLSTSG